MGLRRQAIIIIGKKIICISRNIRGGDEKRFSGVVAFNNIEKTNRCATMGYWLAKSNMGNGHMTAVVKALIEEGFQQLELNRIQARVATGNYPSQAVCERLGLKKEGYWAKPNGFTIISLISP